MYYEISCLFFVLELVMFLKLVVILILIKIRYLKKIKWREYEVVVLLDEEEISLISGLEGGLMCNWVWLVFICLWKICFYSN